MPSPFIGMDPYMEVRAAWHGVHLHLLANLGQQLAPQVRPRYRIHTERYLLLGDAPSKFRPDLRLVRSEKPDGELKPLAATATAATLITENVPYEDTDIPPQLEIVTDEGEVVTIIEVLSPINKEGEYNSYLSKRHQLLRAGIHLVEIDLLREGHRLPLGQDVDAPYMCVVSRANEYPKADVWAVSWKMPLPILPIPLKVGEPDARVELKPAIEQAYSVEFEEFVDYQTDPPGKLTDQWLAEIRELIVPDSLD